MPRHPDHAGDPYTIPVVVKMNPEAIAVLDRLRGRLPRSAFLRTLLRAEAERQRVASRR